MANSPYLTDQAVLGASPEVMGLERGRRLADLLTASGLKQPQGEMISGHYVKPAFTQQINPLVNALVGTTMNKNLDEQQIQMAAMLRGEEAKDIAVYQELKATEGLDVANAYLARSKSPELRKHAISQAIAPPQTKELTEGGKLFEKNAKGEWVAAAEGNKKYHAPSSFDMGTLGTLLIYPDGRREVIQKGKEAHAGQIIDTPNGQMIVDTRTKQATPIMFEGQPVGSAKQLPEGAASQITGIQNVKSALKDLSTNLKDFKALDMGNPNKRALMSTDYQNVVLQLKEAVKLGVLNGNDYAILTSMITDPNSAKALLISKETQMKQIDNLGNKLNDMTSNVYKSHQRPVPPNLQPQGNVQVNSAGQAPRVVDFNSLPTGAR